LIDEQVGKLYKVIEENCTSARVAKQSLRMLLNATELELYLQSAFDHYASFIDTAFDFVKTSFLHKPIPFGFGGNILRLALSLIRDHDVKFGRPDPRLIFKSLSRMIASYILIDTVRHDIKGNQYQSSFARMR
jgi:hypothetical protein